MANSDPKDPEWLLRALDQVPEVFEDPVFAVDTPKSPLRPRMVLWDLLRLVKDGHATDRTGFVDRAFRYASWCSAQDDSELWNPADIGFFAKVAGDGGITLQTLADHLTATQFTKLEELFQHHYGEGKTAEIRRLICGKEGGGNH